MSIQRDTLSEVMVSLRTVVTFVTWLISLNGRQQKYRYRTSSELENSVLEINHVTNVTTVLGETTASDRVSRSSNNWQGCEKDIKAPRLVLFIHDYRVGVFLCFSISHSYLFIVAVRTAVTPEMWWCV